MGRQQARWVLGVLVLATLVACQTPAGSPVGPVPPNPTRVEATRWPTRTATATHTPLPTLTPTATRTPTPTPIPGLALEGLRNLSYPLDGVDGGQVKLADGTYGEDDGPVRVAMADAVTFGDLNDDHRDDAVVLLSERAAGSEPQYHLSVVVNQGGEAVPVTSLPLGDRIVPRSMAVATGRLTLEMLVYAEGDAPCCPSLDSRRIYELSDGELVLVTQWDGPRQGPTVPELSVRHPVPFAPGTMASLIRGRLNPLGDQSYVLPGVAEQALELAVTSPNELVSLSLRGLGDGSVLSSVVSETQRWSGSLPSDQLYVISLVSVSGSATSYALAVTTDPPATVPQAGSVVTPTPTLTSTTSVDAGASEVLTDTLASSEGITDVLTPSTTLSGTVTATPEATGTPAGRQSVPPGSKLTLTFDGVAGTEDRRASGALSFRRGDA